MRVKMEEVQKSPLPYAKVLRVGNFKVWRGKYAIAKGKDADKVDTINVCNLDQSWSVRVPQTFELYSVLMLLLSDYQSEDKKVRTFAEDKLAVIFDNLLYTGCIGNGYYHHALYLVTLAYANPKVFKRGDDKKMFNKEVKSLVKDFLKWRQLYDAERLQNEPTDDDIEKENIADQAIEILQ